MGETVIEKFGLGCRPYQCGGRFNIAVSPTSQCFAPGVQAWGIPFQEPIQKGHALVYQMKEPGSVKQLRHTVTAMAVELWRSVNLKGLTALGTMTDCVDRELSSGVNTPSVNPKPRTTQLQPILESQQPPPAIPASAIPGEKASSSRWRK